MFLIPTKLRVFKFSSYKILMIILVLCNIEVYKNNPYFKKKLQKMDIFSPSKKSL